jgi:anti-sigma regulatory factor (Ser/Thr protein kinase)
LARARRPDNVRLPVTEACTNVVLHAYGHDASHATYILEATQEGATLLITVRDSGIGMPPPGAAVRENASLALASS